MSDQQTGLHTYRSRTQTTLLKMASISCAVVCRLCNSKFSNKLHKWCCNDEYGIWVEIVCVEIYNSNMQKLHLLISDIMTVGSSDLQ